MWNDTWEYTPQDGITHVRNCKVCANFKEHMIVSQLIDGTKDSSAWKIRDQYEQGLIRLGWDLAHEGGRLPQNQTNAVEALE